MVVNASRAITLDSRQPFAQAVAVRDGRILVAGSSAEVSDLIGPETEVVDADGGLLWPAFHDPHLHLLSYARRHARLACGKLTSLVDLQRALRRHAEDLAAGAWLRATGYDEQSLQERRHPDRHDLDAAVADHPVRLQHCSLHLDVLNTLALRLTGLLDSDAAQVERDALTRQATGRVYHGAELLRSRLPRPTEADLASDVRRASDRLLAWGVTTIQDATASNGVDDWELFHRLAAAGAIRQRLLVMAGARHVGQVLAATPASERVGLRHAKLMLDEATTDLNDVCCAVRGVHAAGLSVAIHAISEAEVVMALEALRRSRSGRGTAPDRIEHGGVIADDLLPDLHAAQVMVVGNPSLVYERGDVYLAEYPPEQHGWLHRGRSLLDAGVGYAAASDAPVTEPAPELGLSAAMRRRTRAGAVLSPKERLTPEQAAAVFTLRPAQAGGMAHELGQLRPGFVADMVVLDGDHQVQLTIMNGQVVWRRLL